MRKLLSLFTLLTLLAVTASAVPLTVTPEAKARSFTIELGGGWVPTATPNVLEKPEKDKPDKAFQSVGAFATYEPDAGVMVTNMQRFFPGKMEVIKLGELDALLERDTNGFRIHAGQGSTKIDISYRDGRSSYDKASHDALLQEITSSFRWTR